MLNIIEIKETNISRDKAKSLLRGTDSKRININDSAFSQPQCNIFDIYGNYKFPTDINVEKPNTAFGSIKVLTEIK